MTIDTIDAYQDHGDLSPEPFDESDIAAALVDPRPAADAAIRAVTRRAINSDVS